MGENFVHIGKKDDGTVVWHTSVEEMKRLDGVTKVLKKVPIDEFEAAGGIAREINGVIVIGKTDAEKQREQNVERVRVLKRQLEETDYISAKIAEGSATIQEYAERIAQRQAWREEIREKESA
jgi:hypothetical protein